MKFCTNCGNPLGGAPRFCTRCGKQRRLIGEQATGAGAASGQPRSEAARQPPDTRSAGPAAAPLSPAEAAGPAQFGTAAQFGNPAPFGSTAPFDNPAPFGGLFSADAAEPGGWPDPVPSGAAPGEVSSRATAEQRRRLTRQGRGAEIAAVAVAVIVAGAMAGWLVAGHHGRPHAAANRTDAVASHQPPVASPASATPPPPAGGVAVAIAPGVTPGPVQQQVAAFLGRYFTAINSHRYQIYTGLFDQQMRQSAQQFSAGYGSTVDSGATLTSISATPAGLAATVTFTSHQDSGTAANQVACTDWGITLDLEQTGTGLLIGWPPPGYRASQQPCS